MIQKVLSGLGALLLSGVAGAQSLSVPANFASGESVTVEYENTARPSEWVVIRVCVYGFSELTVQEFTVQTDRQGKATLSWTAPPGLSVTFNAPSVRQVTRSL